jgi:hypothetical protein
MRHPALIAVVLTLVLTTAAASEAYTPSWSICIGKCSDPNPGARIFAGWTPQEIQAYTAFLLVLLHDGAVTAAGTAKYGVDSELNPIAREILRATGIGGLYGAGLAWAVAVYKTAHALKPPLRLLFLQAVTAAHAAASSTWAPIGIQAGGVNVSVTVLEVRW